MGRGGVGGWSYGEINRGRGDWSEEGQSFVTEGVLFWDMVTHCWCSSGPVHTLHVIYLRLTCDWTFSSNFHTVFTKHLMG